MSDIQQLSKMEPGQQGDCYVLLDSKQRGKTRESKPFYRVRFRDAHRTATVMIWYDSGWYAECDQQWKEGHFYKIRCTYRENQYGPQIDLEKIRPVNAEDEAHDFDPTSFLPASAFDPQKMFAELQRLIETEIDELPLRQLVQKLLNDHAERLQNWPGSVWHHHSYRGGFLEHLLSVTRTATFLIAHYRNHYPELQPPLSRSLVISGAILHDIGKLREYELLPQGAQYTAPGKLIGHLIQGRDMIREAAATLPDFPPETLLRLEHILISHQNRPESGSPIPPHTPEALLVHYLDELDTQFHIMVTALTNSQESSELFTSTDNPMKRAIFRGLPDAQRDKKQ